MAMLTSSNTRTTHFSQHIIRKQYIVLQPWQVSIHGVAICRYMENFGYPSGSRNIKSEHYDCFKFRLSQNASVVTEYSHQTRSRTITRGKGSCNMLSSSIFSTFCQGRWPTGGGEGVRTLSPPVPAGRLSAPWAA